MNYWKKRMVEAQEAISKKNVNEAQRKLQKYYVDAMKKVISDFEATYDKLKASKDEPTPADLYKLDRYWQMQAQLKEEAQKLGDKEVELLSKSFENEWNEIYKASALPSDTAFSTISKDNAKAMVNTVWCADGKNFSQRVWGKTDKLVERLNESLVHCVITGKKTTELRQMLQREFNVSRNSANRIIRTEIAYIQTQAAAQRYKDHGRKYYEYLGREENDCGHSPDCHALNGKKFLLTEMEVGVNAPPMHPNCRCCIAPVLNKEMEDKMNNKYTKTCVRCGKTFNTNEEQVKVCPECKAKTQAENNRIIEEAKQKKIKQLQSYGMTNENLNLVKQAWDEGKSADTIKLKTYKRKCAYCGGYLESIYQRGDVYHDRCLEEMKFDKLQEIVTCVDCGEDFIRYKKYKNQVRCPECQAKHRKQYKAQKERERRAKKKNKK